MTQMMQRPIACAMLFLAVGLAVTDAALAGAYQIAQKGRQFAVRSIEIAPGDVVRFTNDDEFLHQIFISAGSFNFDSAEQPPGQTIEVKFPSPGLYAVRCHIHPKMLLSVIAR